MLIMGGHIENWRDPIIVFQVIVLTIFFYSLTLTFDLG